MRERFGPKEKKKVKFETAIDFLEMGRRNIREKTNGRILSVAGGIFLVKVINFYFKLTLSVRNYEPKSKLLRFGFQFKLKQIELSHFEVI
ncbi:hypothetical protein CEXT_539121 [Caerostris extrusa]|uniref:Uncharacterized protein n=1 Tax=Caerostris extrusa TaxID=172846 RepID=A0AAV4P7I5_CAEEX|nr:hypothetical protein CEXT_539121 [Caerostris extrusa]